MSAGNGTDPIVEGLQARGSAIRGVRYRENRSVLLSVSRDGRTLNSHACFRDAPPEIVRAVVAAVTSRGAARRRALRAIRGWEGTHRGLERARRRRPRRRPGVNGAETAPLRVLFDRFNRAEFGGRLPAIPLRVSRRMTRTLGTIAYSGSGARRVREIAIAAALLKPGNRETLVDTLLHEMAHAEAWLDHGHRGHGRPWKRIAERVGCRPRARTDVRIAGGRR